MPHNFCAPIRPNAYDEAIDIHAVAKLYVDLIDREAQGESVNTFTAIAEELGIHRARVALLFQRARSRGIIKTEYRPEGVPAEKVRLRINSAPLRILKKVEHEIPETALRNIFIVNVDDRQKRRDDSEDLLAAFGRGASEHLLALLSAGESATVGVSSGPTLRHTLAALKLHSDELRLRKQELSILPLSGESLAHPGHPESSSELAADLHRLLAPNGNALSLRLVPAFVPPFVSENAKSATDFKRYLAQIPDYQAVACGSPDSPALFDKVDTMITSVSSPSSACTQPPLREFLSYSKLTPADLDQLFVGEMGGVLIPKPDAPPWAGLFQKLWTGITLDQIRKCAARRKSPGVILYSVAETDASRVFELLRLNLVNELVVGKRLAATLEQLLDDKRVF
jgi:hypothetical protein